MARSTKPKGVRSCIAWFVCLGTTPVDFAYTKKQVIADFMRNCGPKYTWEQMQRAGYYVTKAQINPLQDATDEQA